MIPEREKQCHINHEFIVNLSCINWESAYAMYLKTKVSKMTNIQDLKNHQ